MNILAKTKRLFSPTQVNGKLIRHPQFQVYKSLYVAVRPKWSPRGGGFTKGVYIPNTLDVTYPCHSTLFFLIPL